jgi:hypothetical protein
MDLTQKRVGRNRARVAELRDLGGIDLAQQCAQRVEQALFGRSRRRSHLESYDGDTVGRHKIGKRPADIDANAPTQAGWTFVSPACR